MAKEGKSEWLDWLIALVVAFVIVFVVRAFLFSPIVVDGPSMMPTLQDKDQMIVNKISYRFKEPERFDIIIFHATKEKDYVKRVIGLPGEHVAVKDDVLFINGDEVAEPYLDERKAQLVAFQKLTEDFKLEDIAPTGYEAIPAGYVLVLGDNRTDSTDSRSSSLGLVSMEDIVGKTRLIYWPIKRMQIVKE